MFCLTKLAIFCPQSIKCAFYTAKIESQLRAVLKDRLPPSSLKLLPKSRYGGEDLVTLLTGSTLIGKQASNYIRTLFQTAKVPVEFENISVNTTSDIPLEFVTSVLRNRCAIQVDVQHDPKEKHKSLLLANELDLFACIIKMNSFPGYNCKFPDLDITLITQNNTGDFTKLEYEPVKGIVETLKFSQDTVMKRYLNFVFDYAVKNCRKKITVAHQIKELPKTDGMFLKIASELQKKEYPNLELDFMPVNKMVRYLVMQPCIFDMICTNDRYGTFIASICSAVCGGASLFSAMDIGDHHAVFKPLQTKLSLTSNRSLSPYGVVRACIELLRYLENHECAQALWDELMRTMLESEVRTTDFGGTDSGDYVICHIVNNLKCKFAG